jgi:hypothetical protein
MTELVEVIVKLGFVHASAKRELIDHDRREWSA